MKEKEGLTIKQGELKYISQPKSKLMRLLIWLKIVKPWVISIEVLDTEKKTDPAVSG